MKGAQGWGWSRFLMSVVKLLIGVDISGAAVALSRVAGVALLALGLASWLARGHAASALTTASAMLLYNCGVAAVLAMSGVSGMIGVLLWPAMTLHAGMAVWSFMMSPRGLTYLSH